MSARAAAVGDCFCRCHEINDECMFCAEHPEMHRDAQVNLRECPNPEAHRASVPAAVNAGKQSNSPAPRAELLHPEPTPVGRYRNPFVLAIAILTPIIFCLPFYLYGTGISDVEVQPSVGLDVVSFPELSAFDQSITIVAWAGASTVLATIGVTVVVLIGTPLYITFWPLGLLSAFLLKPFKPILLPIAYPFIGAWAAIRYSLIGVWLTACFGVCFMRNLLFFPSFCRRHTSICDSEDDCCIGECVFGFSVMMIVILTAWAALTHGSNGEPVPVLLPIIAVSLLSTNCLSGLYELGRWRHNKRATQATQEKPNLVV